MFSTKNAKDTTKERQKIFNLIKKQDSSIAKRLATIELDNIFADIITIDLIANPRIVPQGTTYAESTLKEIKYIDPTTKEDVEKSHRSNFIFNDLLLYYLQNDPDKTTIPSILCCPLTKKIFIEPVVANNGITYERAELLKFLATHNNKLPNSKLYNTTDFNRSDYPYKNHVASEIIKKLYINHPQYKQHAQDIKQHPNFTASKSEQIKNKKIKFLKNLKNAVDDWRHTGRHSALYTFFNIMPTGITQLQDLLANENDFEKNPDEFLKKSAKILRKRVQIEKKSRSPHVLKSYLKWNDNINELLSLKAPLQLKKKL